jgi:hypothetical protein
MCITRQILAHNQTRQFAVNKFHDRRKKMKTTKEDGANSNLVKLQNGVGSRCRGGMLINAYSTRKEEQIICLNMQYL